MSSILLNAEDSQLSECVIQMSRIIHPTELFMIYSPGWNFSKDLTCVLRNPTIILSAPHARSLSKYSLSICTEYHAQKPSGKLCSQGRSPERRNTHAQSALGRAGTAFKIVWVCHMRSKCPVWLVEVALYFFLAKYLMCYNAFFLGIAFSHVDLA